MARSVEAILKEQLGNLLLQLAILQSQLEESLEKNKSYEQAATDKPPQAPMKVIK